MIYFYSRFIKKLICAARNNGTEPYFRFDEEIGRADFIKFANKFIEDYYATVSPEFGVTHPMKFAFGVISEDEVLVVSPNLGSRDLENHPEINGGILYIETRNGKQEEDRHLDASIFRQACFIRRERWKFLMTILGSVVAVGALLLSLLFRK